MVVLLYSETFITKKGSFRSLDIIDFTELYKFFKMKLSDLFISGNGRKIGENRRAEPTLKGYVMSNITRELKLIACECYFIIDW